MRPHSKLPSSRAETGFAELAEILRASEEELDQFANFIAERMAECFERGGKVIACGCGGSAATAQHFAAELLGRLSAEHERAPLAAIALSDLTVVSAIGNDFGFEEVFARQVRALGSEGDVFVALTTSGRSRAVLEAVEAARSRGCVVVALTGAKGLACDLHTLPTLRVRSESAARVQEIHLACLHEAVAHLEHRMGRGSRR
jgi:phosphoheptose isomerase